MSVNVKMMPKSTATFTIGSIIGMVIWNMVRQNPAPSTAAASGISRGIAVSPASSITVENGSKRKLYTPINDIIAIEGSQSHIGQSHGRYWYNVLCTQLIYI